MYYIRAQMSQNSKHIRAFLTAEVYGYFNNHYHGYAPENCIDVLEMLGIATLEQKEAGQHIGTSMILGH